MPTMLLLLLLLLMSVFLLSFLLVVASRALSDPFSANATPYEDINFDSSRNLRRSYSTSTSSSSSSYSLEENPRTFFVLRPECHVYNLGLDKRTGRTHFRIECEELSDWNDDDYEYDDDEVYYNNGEDDTYYGSGDDNSNNNNDDEATPGGNHVDDDATDEDTDETAENGIDEEEEEDAYDDGTDVDPTGNGTDDNDSSTQDDKQEGEDDSLSADDAVIAGAETEVVDQQSNSESMNNASSVWASVGISALAGLVLLATCFFCFGGWSRRCSSSNRGKNLPGRNSSKVGDDTKKEIPAEKGDVKEAHSMPANGTYIAPNDNDDVSSLTDGRDRIYNNGMMGETAIGGGILASGAFVDLEDESQWESYFQSLVEYRKEHGNCLVPSDYTDPKDGRPLGKWVALQKHLAEASELPPGKIDRLSKLDFIWELQDVDGSSEDFGIITDPEKWQEYLKALKDYKAAHNGSTNVPPYYKDSQGRALGAWVRHQQHLAKQNSISAEQKAQLDALAFAWTIPVAPGIYEDDDGFIDPFTHWDEYINSLTAYKAEHGNCLPPREYRDESGRPLGQWVTLQRHLASAGDLSEPKIDQLTALGFAWQLQDGDGTASEHGIVRDKRLEKQYLQSLKSYKKKHGDYLVPASYIDDEGRCLGAWVRHQRYKATHGLLTEEQLSKLDDLGFDWNPRYTATLTGSLVAGSSVTKKLKSKSLNTNGSSFFRRLLGGNSAAKGKDNFGPHSDDQWDEYVRSLKKYQAASGDCNVPRDYVDGNGLPLGEWVSLQRIRSVEEGLSADQQGELSSLGFDWKLQPEDEKYRNGPTAADVTRDWNSFVKALVQYKKEYSDCMVPPSYHDKKGRLLGEWVANVRDVAAQNELSPPKRKQLEVLGFNWETPRGDGYGLQGGRGYGRWESHFQALTQYKVVNGNCNVPLTYKDADAQGVGSWAANMRHRAAMDELPLKNRERLNDIGFDWEANIRGDGTDQSVWDMHVQALKDFKNEHGSAHVPANFENRSAIGLGSWCTNQRRRAAQDQLGSERRKELAALGFDWNGEDQGLGELFRYDETGRPANMDVHRCVSANCEACQAEEPKGVRLLHFRW